MGLKVRGEFLHSSSSFFLPLHELGVYLTMLLLDHTVYCRVISGKWVGKFVRGRVGGLVWTYCSGICPEGKKACHIAMVHRVCNTRHREYGGRVLPSQHLVDA